MRPPLSLSLPGHHTTPASVARPTAYGLLLCHCHACGPWATAQSQDRKVNSNSIGDWGWRWRWRWCQVPKQKVLVLPVPATKARTGWGLLTDVLLCNNRSGPGCVPPIHRLTAVFLWHRCNFAGYIIEAQLAVFLILLYLLYSIGFIAASLSAAVSAAALTSLKRQAHTDSHTESSMQGGRIRYMLCRSGIFLLGCSALVSSGNVPRDSESDLISAVYSALVRLTILPVIVIGCSRASGAAPSSINHRGGAALLKCHLDRTFFCRN